MLLLCGLSPRAAQPRVDSAHEVAGACKTAAEAAPAAAGALVAGIGAGAIG